MKIAVIGTQCSGKTTYIDDFIKEWPEYTRSDKASYTSLVKEKGIVLNEEGTEESQRAILNVLADQVIYTPKQSNIIFDRSVLDNLVYTLWLNANGKVSDQFVAETKKIVRETLTFYDLLLFLPLTRHSPIEFTPKEHRSNNPVYREEIDNIFKALVHRYNIHDKSYFPLDHTLGCPAIVEIYGNPEERIALTKMYIQPDGSAYTEEKSLLDTGEKDPEKPHILEF